MNQTRKIGLALLALLALQACESDNDADVVAPAPVAVAPDPTAGFSITVTNLTNAQPLSPIAIITHYSGFTLFSLGAPASNGLEDLAEGGSNASLLNEADADGNVRLTASGAGPVGPGGSETVSFEVFERELTDLRLSVATMLVNTNDAFSGINATLLEDMQAGDVIEQYAIVYDAGTESDNESATDIPGPAGGGEGFNAARDDEADRVSMHAGVVGMDDGLPTSSLNNQHRFDNPAVRIRIERTQ